MNHNATFHENGTISFVPKRKCVLLLDRSIGDPSKDIVVVPNLVLLAASTASAKLSSFAALGVSTLVKSLNAKPLINLTVNDFMWGYDDNLVKLANNLIPNIITFERLGVLDRVSRCVILSELKLFFITMQLFDEGHNIVSMMLPEGARQFNDERKRREESEKLKIFQKQTELIRNLEVISSTMSPEKTSQVSDVVYDEDFDETIIDKSHDLFNEIPSMALKTVPQTTTKLKYEVPEVRDFSIDVWNGSPGLKYWGYNDSNHDE